MNILILVAGTNEPSNSATLADAFMKGLQKHRNTHITKVHIKDLSIAPFTLEFYDPRMDQGEDFTKVQRLMEQADGFVIASPVWNFSVPAHLKNLIDRIGSFGLDVETRSRGMLKGKPFYIILTGGTPVSGWHALMRKTTSHLQESLQYFGASYIGEHYEPKCMKGRGVFGLVVHERPASLSAVERKGHDFGKVVLEYNQKGKAPLYHRTKAKVMKWGENVLKKMT
ncbi:MAG TPA: NAD(P)H-dependent oxidoreductase [Candidatus Peribacterales bacterium]|uniref:NADPH-dependent FMN reductase-like domain-containing protein n=1 Tax=Candidatus Kaiserbacteria bacterium RIFCSPHIGHO2_01_FULL_56_24 TaxID=1798487 RepID=A0A1F6DA41_9BACT|nr:MAG: hypothetical protein A2765_05355 [Candidatus Kaiserbacteria bacterium RIFCSPHIGHO2_01_FULL_56_24]HLD08316.1 NAD(P)H-dependent oxidoreductase [Candidatus Peribacterales bacterium]